MMGKTILDQQAIDIGQQVISVAREIDNCTTCIITTSIDNPSFEKIIKYHFGGHKYEEEKKTPGEVSGEQKVDRQTEKNTESE